MPIENRRLLLVGGLVTGAAALLHLAIIGGGPSWYRFFGAGERMARLAARGAPAPAVLTAGIALVLAVWALYALSGAGVIRFRLPMLRPVLALIATVYLLRGVLGVPVVLVATGPYAQELRGRMAFTVLSSLVCVGLGVCYAAGAVGLGRSRGPARPFAARTRD
jgi:hypothetical protein